MKKRRIQRKNLFFFIGVLLLFFLRPTRCFAAGEDYVDVISNIDGIADIGTHSNFEAEKAYDSSFDTLTEEDTGEVGSDTEDDIDINTTDVDSSPDKGTETNFPYAQGTSLDSQYMNIQEENTGGEAVNEWKDCNGYDSTYTQWTKVGTAPYLNAQDEPTHYIYTNKAGYADGWYDFADTAATGGGISLNISLYCQGDGGDSIDIYIDYTGSGAGSLVGNVVPDTSYSYKTLDLGTHTASEINSARAYFVHVNAGKANEIDLDHARLGLSRTASENYEIDFEYGWQNADFDEQNEEVCIYVGSHTGSETLNINYWAGSWISLGSITGLGWTNVTATGLTSSTYTIQLIGASESGDSAQDNWDIDLITLHTWTPAQPNYKLNLEIQWQNADFDEQNEEVCIATGTFSGTEDIKIYEWDISGSQWYLVGTLAANQWNNFTISYLTSSNYYIKYEGASESGDTAQDTWQIDAALINCYTSETTTETTTTQNKNDPPNSPNNDPVIQSLMLFALNAITFLFMVMIIIKLLKKVFDVS